ncbi:hypothetical protein JCM31598_12730 [Desulfonatronum parangueonense]
MVAKSSLSKWILEFEVILGISSKNHVPLKLFKCKNIIKKDIKNRCQQFFTAKSTYPKLNIC